MIQNPKVIAATACIILFTGIVWISAVRLINGDLEKTLREERLRSETYLSEKLHFEKEIAKMKLDFKNVISQNAQLDREIFTANKKLKQQEAELIAQRMDAYPENEIQKKYNELKQIKLELEQQLSRTNTTLINVKKDNSELANTLALQEITNHNLTDALNEAKLVTLDDIRIETIKKKSHTLTTTAKHTKKMILTFEITALIPGDLQYTITDPSGTVLTKKNGTITYNTLPDDAALTASVNGNPPQKKKQMQMIYETKERLHSGVYTIEVSNKGLHIGSLQVRLR